MESGLGGSKTARPRSLLVVGTMEMTIEVGEATKAADWPVASPLAQDPGSPALGGRVRGGVSEGTRVAERSDLPVAIYPTKAHINPKL